MSDQKEPETVPQTRRAAGEGTYIPLSALHAFPGHPFKVMRDAAMEELVQSVRANGVLSRIIVRPRRAGGYEIIAGHRRSEAARLAGLTEVPAEVRRDLDDDAAVIAMIETNLKQRTRLLPSERALAYRMMRDALAHQGVSSGNGRHTREEIADKYGESPRQVARFIRLTSLNRPLLELVDRGKLQMGAAVEISYLDTETQCWVMDHFEATGRTPAIAQARELRRAYGEGALTQEAFAGIMLLREEGKVAGGEKGFVRRMREEYFPNMTAGDVMEKLRELVEAYQRRQNLNL